MRKTAGYCVTGQERGGGGRYARIELSEKVCDSAGNAFSLRQIDYSNKLLGSPSMSICDVMHSKIFIWVYIRLHLLITFSLFLPPRSSQGHTDSRDVSRCHLAD